MTSLVDFTAESGTAEPVWTTYMKNGDTIRLHQTVIADPINTHNYCPEEVPTETAEELQALIDEIAETLTPEAGVNIHLPAVTYDGNLVIERSVNPYGSEGEDGPRTTFTVPVRVSMAG